MQTMSLRRCNLIQIVLQVTLFLIRASLAAVLVASGAAKLADVGSFASTLIGLGVPVRRRLLLRGLARAIPLVEVGLGLAVVSGLWPTVINGAVLTLMCVFTIVVIVALRRKLNVACRCFGILSDSQFSNKGLARSVLLTVLALVIFCTYSPQSNYAPGLVIPLVAGFLLFAFAAAQAAKTIAILKEDMY
jgi:uncharacterized membrane protein YphA (DoxX/SURF4 family)